MPAEQHNTKMHNRPLSSIFTLPPVQTHTFTTSWLLPPLALGLLRLLIFTYCFSNQLACWIYYATHDSAELIGQQFSYFTNLTFWGILFYSLVAGVHTLVYRVRGRSWLDSWPRALRQLHSLFYTTIVTLPFLVTLVYWIVLYEGPWFPVVFDGYSNVSACPSRKRKRPPLLEYQCLNSNHRDLTDESRSPGTR